MKPILFETKFFTINTLWVFVALALIIGTYALIKFSIKQGLKIQFLSEHSTRLILWTIIGARIVTIALNYHTYFYEFSIKTFINLFAIWDKGLNLWGGMIAFFIALFFYCKKSDQDFFKWLDAIIPAFITALAIGHIGTFFDGISYGKPSGLPWAVNFESPSIKYTVPIHPTQIYAFIYATIIAIGISLISQNEKIKNLEKSGFLGLLGVTVYSFFRFLEEFVRGDDVFLILGIRLSQIFTFIVLISTGIFLYLRYNKRRWKK